MAPSGTLWPNGEFTMGYAHAGGDEPLESAAEYAEKWDAPIDLSHPVNSHMDTEIEKKKRGQGGLTAYGKRLIRNSVYAMERVYRKRQLAFCTLTYPDCPKWKAWSIATDWSRIVKVFFQKLGRHLKDAGLPVDYVSVTEMHPERSERDEAPYLHLHFVIVTRLKNEKGFRISPGELRWIWASVIGWHFPEQSYWGSVENMSVVRKSASNYMAKYVAKSSVRPEPVISSETGWSLPTAWYNISMRVKRWVKARCYRSTEVMTLIERAAVMGMGELAFEYLFAGEIPEMSGPGPHFWVGKLRPGPMQEIIEIYRAENID